MIRTGSLQSPSIKNLLNFAELRVEPLNQLELIDNINEARNKRGAVILAHNYQRPEVQAIADYTGDSLGLRSEERRVGKECRSRWSPYH